MNVWGRILVTAEISEVREMPVGTFNAHHVDGKQRAIAFAKRLARSAACERQGLSYRVYDQDGNLVYWSRTDKEIGELRLRLAETDSKAGYRKRGE